MKLELSIQRIPVILLASLLLSGQSNAAPPDDALPINVTGEVTVLYMDDFENRFSEVQYFIEDKQSNRRYRLRFDGTPPADLRTGQTVTLRGRPSGEELIMAADGDGSGGDGATSSPTPAVAGEQRTLVMVGNFNDANVSCSVDAIRDLMFTDPANNSIDDLYRENSFGHVWFSGQVVGPYALDFNNDSCELDGWSSAADAAARAEGIEPDLYDRKVYVLPPGSCRGAGYGSVLGNPTRAWILKCDFRDTYAHELGHNMGMAHASSPGCEYCDLTDFMGTGNNKLRHNNAPHKDQMGWLQGAQIRNITQSGTFDIAPLEPLPENTLAPQALKVFKPDTGEYYYLSYRRAIGFDTSLSPISQLDRLAVHRASGDGSGGNTYLLAQLTDGESHADTINGITFTVISHNDDYVTVDVSLTGSDPSPTCTPGVPQLSIAPTAQSATAGSTVEYSVQLSNQDSGACASSTFTLLESIPSGWTGTVSPSSISLAPGQSDAATLWVTSAADAAVDAYSTGVSVSDTGEPAHSNSASATYSVVAACSPSAPTLGLSPASQSGNPGETRAYSITLVNNDSAACGASTFDLSYVLPGWSGSVSPATLTLLPGGSGTASLSVTSSATAEPGTYSVQVQATDSQDAGHSASRNASYIVNDTTSTGDAEAPSSPTDLSASANFKQVNLSWVASTDNTGVIGYRVYRDGSIISSTANTGYTDVTGAEGVVYEYTVDAYDAASNVSPKSTPVMAGKVKAKAKGKGGGKGKGPNK